MLTAFSLLMNFVLQKLGIVLSDKELAKLKEATLLKQVTIIMSLQIPRSSKGVESCALGVQQLL